MGNAVSIYGRERERGREGEKESKREGKGTEGIEVKIIVERRTFLL